jgi:predicted Rossmann fold flavoprotein
MRKVRHVVVVGGGAAGMIAAWRAASCGARVTLLEKTARLGTKILISGGGKCNICHDGDMRDVLAAFRKNEAEFLRPSVYRFPNREIVKLVTARGVEVYTRPDGRIFPRDKTAKEVVAALASYVYEAGVRVCLERPVSAVRVEAGRAIGVEAGEFIAADAVVVSTGGSSYPGTGTTGDGWKWLREVGHRTLPIRAALAPMYLTLDGPGERLPPEIRAGVALRDVVLRARLGTALVDKWRGDVLLTHHGVSGPAVLGVSRAVAERWGAGEATLEADVTPDLSFEALTARLSGFVAAGPKRRLLGFVEEFVPSRLALPLLLDAGLSAEQAGLGTAKKALNRLVATLKGWNLGTVRHVPLEKGEVVAGGVALDEVDPRTMASRLCGGLYLCGEVLDIAGPVGGYNLQAAFATGFVAGEAAAQ